MSLSHKCIPLLLILVYVSSCSQRPQTVDKSAGTDAHQAEIEAAFCSSMKGATLKGFFTMRGKHQHKGLAEDSYIIHSIDKVDGIVDGNVWKMEVGIQYGTINVRVPLFVPIEWAGDTPVITIDKMMIPGIGTYSAHVLFRGKHYAGTWDGDGYGGELFGQILNQ